jgi:hypothetical protein
MSVDLWLGEEFAINFTYNYGPMWHLATGRKQTVDVDEMSGGASSLIFEKAIAAVEANPTAFRKLNPENGWGTAEHFLKALKLCLQACEKNMDATWLAYR